jgi:hypothetical protein
MPADRHNQHVVGRLDIALSKGLAGSDLARKDFTHFQLSPASMISIYAGSPPFSALCR